MSLSIVIAQFINLNEDITKIIYMENNSLAVKYKSLYNTSFQITVFRVYSIQRKDKL